MCNVYEADGDQMPTAVSFLLAGLESNEKCLFFGDRSQRDEVFEAVLKSGIVDQDALSRQLTYLTVGEVYLRDNRFEAQRMLGFLGELERQAVAEGFAGMRGVGEMTWACSDAPGTEDLIEYEARLNYLCPKSPSSLLCLYEEGSFEPSTLIDVVRVHPQVVVKGTLCRNPYYMPPDEFLSSLKGEVPLSVYERASNDIFRRARCAELHMLELKDLRRANTQLALLNDVAFNDIRNEISIMAFLSEIALECCPDDRTRSYIEEVAGRCQAVQRQLDFIKACQSISDSGSRWQSLVEVVTRAASSIEGSSIRLRQLGSSYSVFANANLGTALLLLLENVARLVPKGAEARLESSEGNDGLRLTVSAPCRGVPEALKERLFERGYSVGGSDGYELCLCREILLMTGITIRESGVPGKDVRFEIWVPKGKYKEE